MNLIYTKEINSINGYLDALSDMSGKNYEFFGKVFLSKENNTKLILENLFTYMNKTYNIVEQNTIEDYSLPSILNKLIILKPYSEFYGSLENNIIPKNIETEYKEYITNRLSDSIYNIYAKLRDINLLKEPSKLTLILAKDTNENYCIIVIETKNNYNLIFYFYYRLGTKEEYISLYETIKEQQDYSNIKIDTNNNLSDSTVNRLTRVLNKILSQGFMDNELKSILLEHYTEEKVNDLKKIYEV